MTMNPYAGALGGLDPLPVIAATPERVRALAARLSREQIDVASAPGKWSVREVLAHMADCEVAFGFRLRQVQAGAAAIQPFDQDAWALTYAVYSAELAIATFVALRAWNVVLIGGFTAADLAKEASHPERGAMTLRTIVETMAGHDLHHVAALEKF